LLCQLDETLEFSRLLLKFNQVHVPRRVFAAEEPVEFLLALER
jgi:hypothetical protein